MGPVVIGVFFVLPAFAVEHLLYVALLVEQPHTDNRHTQVAGGFHMVARQHAQTAGVNGQPFANAVFHREIRRQQVAVFVAVFVVPGVLVVFVVVIGFFNFV